MPDDLIARVGESLFGLGWETEMAIALDVPEDALRRWAKGEEPPKPACMMSLQCSCRAPGRAPRAC